MKTCKRDHSRTTTPFCPECGAPLGSATGSPQALLAYLNRQKDRAAIELKVRQERRSQVNPSPRTRTADSIEVAEEHLARWTAWAEWVEAAIK